MFFFSFFISFFFLLVEIEKPYTFGFFGGTQCLSAVRTYRGKILFRNYSNPLEDLYVYNMKKGKVENKRKRHNALTPD